MFSTEYSSNNGIHQAYQRKFPIKLWKLINSPKQSEDGKPIEKSITWTRDGESIMITSDEFESQYLHNDTPVFKAGRMSSFVRQLNLYGFKKHGHHRYPMGLQNRNASLLIYSHPNFKRDRPDLVMNVSRKAASVVREEAKVLKASIRMMEISTPSKNKNTKAVPPIKHSTISPSLQNARNNLNEVLDQHFLELLESYNAKLALESPLPDDPYADIDHIGAEEIIDDSHEFDLNTIVGPQYGYENHVNVTDLCRAADSEPEDMPDAHEKGVWVVDRGEELISKKDHRQVKSNGAKKTGKLEVPAGKLKGRRSGQQSARTNGCPSFNKLTSPDVQISNKENSFTGNSSSQNIALINERPRPKNSRSKKKSLSTDIGSSQEVTHAIEPMRSAKFAQSDTRTSSQESSFVGSVSSQEIGRTIENMNSDKYVWRDMQTTSHDFSLLVTSVSSQEIKLAVEKLISDKHIWRDMQTSSQETSSIGSGSSQEIAHAIEPMHSAKFARNDNQASSQESSSVGSGSSQEIAHANDSMYSAQFVWRGVQTLGQGSSSGGSGSSKEYPHAFYPAHSDMSAWRDTQASSQESSSVASGSSQDNQDKGPTPKARKRDQWLPLGKKLCSRDECLSLGNNFSSCNICSVQVPDYQRVETHVLSPVVGYGDIVDVINVAEDGFADSLGQFTAERDSHDILTGDYPLKDQDVHMRDSWIEIDDLCDIYPNTHFSFDDLILDPYVIEASGFMKDSN